MYSRMFSLRSTVVPSLLVVFTIREKISGNFLRMLNFRKIYKPILRRLRQLKRHVGVEVMRQLITSFIFSRLDYCNALLVNLPFSTIAPLQPVQNAAARLLLGLPRRDHVRPALKELHWLPVVFRINFKVALMML